MKDRTRKALEDLLGQVVQARDGFGIYQQSKSMDSAVKEAAAALASQPSDLRAKLEALRDDMESNSWIHKQLTAILEGKD